MAVLGLHCGTPASHCGGFSSCRAQARGARASVVAAHGLRSCGTQTQELWYMGSGIVVHGLRSCGIRASVVAVTSSGVVVHGLQ